MQKSGQNSTTCSQSSAAATNPFEEIQSTSTPLKTRPTSSALMVDSQTSPVQELRTPTPPKKRKYVETSCSPHIKRPCLRPIEELTLPLSKEEEAYNTRMNRMSNSDDKLTLVCKTRGQPYVKKFSGGKKIVHCCFITCEEAKVKTDAENQAGYLGWG